jgi:hypothetical protein
MSTPPTESSPLPLTPSPAPRPLAHRSRTVLTVYHLFDRHIPHLPITLAPKTLPPDPTPTQTIQPIRGILLTPTTDRATETLRALVTIAPSSIVLSLAWSLTRLVPSNHVPRVH